MAHHCLRFLGPGHWWKVGICKLSQKQTLTVFVQKLIGMIELMRYAVLRRLRAGVQHGRRKRVMEKGRRDKVAIDAEYCKKMRYIHLVGGQPILLFAHPAWLCCRICRRTARR
jgi:hypothetical protein